MTMAQTGDSVHVHYTGTLDDGTEFDSSLGREPLAFTLGSGQVIQGFDEAITGMKIGEKKTIRIDAKDAYGMPQKELIVEFAKEHIPKDIDLEIGMELHLSRPDKQAVPAKVIELSETNVTLDANHPLAGKALTFALELMAIG